MFASRPQAAGLYDPRYEHDACGVALVARLDDRPTRQVVDMALSALANLEHRGATGADARTGDGAGILTQLPDAFLRAVVPFELPARGRYAVASVFLPTDRVRREKLEALLELNVRVEGQRVLGWRDVRSTRSTSATSRAARVPSSASCSSPPGRASTPTRTPSSASSTSSARRRARRRPRLLRRLVLEPDGRLEGHAHGHAAARLLPRPAGTRG
jgi:hypothetical protein